MRRREFIAALGGAAAGFVAPTRWSLAQTRQFRIGVLALSPPKQRYLNALRDGLSERGLMDGQNLSIDVRSSQGSVDQLSNIVAEFVRSNVDLIVTWTTPPTMAAKVATSTIPIVFVGVSNPIDAGFVANLARPGGNITGVSNIASDLSVKLVELLREIAPETKLVGVVINPANPGSMFQLSGIEAAIRALGFKIIRAEADRPEEYGRAFARMKAEGAQGVVLAADGSLIEFDREVAELAIAARLPTIFQRRENAEAGGLLSYGPNLVGMFRQISVYIDRILKGTKPSELPVQQPTTFELVVNVRTAKALGLTVPPTLIARADEVIE
jgi:putative ABC transport system substrate-binding protein